MAILRIGPTSAGCSLDSSSLVRFVSAQRQLASCSSKVSFAGHLLRRQSQTHAISRRRNDTVLVRAHQHHSHGTGPPPGIVIHVPGDGILDDVSRYIYRKISSRIPADFDLLDFLPENIHRMLHRGEAAAVVVLRELLHFGLFYVLFFRVDAICKWFNWVYAMYMKDTRDYESSSFQAMADPMRLVIVVWAVTRFAHIITPLLKLHLEVGVTSKARSIGLVVAVTWFFFKWKNFYVANLVSTYKIDAPRILAFDKVISLLMYLVAASCIGEVTGFALRSLLAVGGFSGVALGLAAKEIVSNFFGGAVLFITRPFVIGERIKAGSFAGYVQDIGFLQTKILSFDQMPMVVPNQSFINQVITNYSRANSRLLQANFPVRMQDIFLVDRITSQVATYLREHPDVDATKSTPYCYLKSLEAPETASLILTISCIVRFAGGSRYYMAQQRILMHVADIIMAEGALLGCNAPFDSVVPGIIDNPAGDPLDN